MPRLNGLEATREIRQFEQERRDLRPVEIWACTGHAMEDDRKEFMDAGASGFFSKPLKKADIMVLVRMAQHEHGLQRTDSAPASHNS